MTQLIVFVDLDDTLFHTRRKHRPEDLDRLETAAFDRDGSPLSFISPRQRVFLDWLGTSALLVPSTGRSVEQLRRVLLPFPGPAICSLGGVVLGPDGQPDPRWHAHVAERIGAHGEALPGLAEEARRLADDAGQPVRLRVVEDAGLQLFLVVKHAAEDLAALAALAEPLRARVPPGWRVWCHDNTLAAVPPGLDKAEAVRFYREHLAPPDAVAIGVGDAHSDADFLAACDYAVMPSRSALFSKLHGGIH